MKLLLLSFSLLLLMVGPMAMAAPDFAAKVQQSMMLLKEKTAKLGVPSIKGETTTAGKKVPFLYFGSNKMNEVYDVVDSLKNQMGGTATLFVKSGSEFVRISTNVQKADGQRAIGTILDPNGKAIKEINQGNPFYGDVDILGRMYTTGYEPIFDSSKNIIGIYYVGYLKL